MFGIGYGWIFQHANKVVDGNATLAQQLLAAVDMPANGSYIDVSSAKYVYILARLGVIHASDAVVLTPKCSDAVDGTLDSILDRDGDAWGAHTIAADDDEEWIAWALEVESLPLDHHFLSVDVSGTTANGSYGMIMFFLSEQDVPVTQTTAVLPTTSQYWLGGGQAQDA